METTEQQLDIRFSKKQQEVFFPEGDFPTYTVIPKSRRSGFTRGCAHAIILYSLRDDYPFLPKGEIQILWIETIHANINRYFERYFLPVLRQIDTKQWRWRQQDGILELGRSVIDFKSSERPENILGGGYALIVVNEAGVVLTGLSGRYLFGNVLQPMLVDYPNSKMILGGTPTGRHDSEGTHLFFELAERAKYDKKNYRLIRMLGADNPFISQSALATLGQNMDDLTYRQELLGEFVHVASSRFLYLMTDDHIINEQSFTPNPHLPLLFAYDFNVNPMTVLAGQRITSKRAVIFDEIIMSNGSTPEVNEIIKHKYKKWLNNFDVCGDATGRNRSAMVKGNLNHWRIIKQDLELSDRNLLVKKSNPALKDSQVLCNSVLQNAELRITENCKTLIRDLFTAAVDSSNELIKDANHPLHAFDSFRYFIHCIYPDFIKHPERYS